MTTLGIDPGVRFVGWVLLVDGDLADQGQWSVTTRKGTGQWQHSLTEHIRLAGHLLDELCPDVVGIEAIQVQHGMLGAGGETPNMARARSQAAMTQRTSELIAMLAALAGAIGATVHLIHPATGLARLGCKRGATDRDISAAYNRRWGQELLVREHHIARAAGVALAAMGGKR